MSEPSGRPSRDLARGGPRRRAPAREQPLPQPGQRPGLDPGEPEPGRRSRTDLIHRAARACCGSSRHAVADEREACALLVQPKGRGRAIATAATARTRRHRSGGGLGRSHRLRCRDPCEGSVTRALYTIAPERQRTFRASVAAVRTTGPTTSSCSRGRPSASAGRHRHPAHDRHLRDRRGAHGGPPGRGARRGRGRPARGPA